MVLSLPVCPACQQGVSSSLTEVPSTVRLILGDQLNPEHSWFGKKDASVTYVLMEVRSETDYVVHHAQKVIAIFAGMRRMAELLTKQGHQVRYFRLSDKDNRQNFAENLLQVFKATKAARFSAKSAVPPAWSMCAWVIQICSSVTPSCLQASSNTGKSPPGSMMAPCMVSSHQTMEQFCWKGVTGTVS